MDGELMFCVHDHFSSGPAEVHELQIPQLGGNKAYPDQPFWFCRLEKDIAGDVAVAVPDFETLALPGAETQTPAIAGSAVTKHRHTVAYSFPTLITYLQRSALICCYAAA